MTFSKRRFSVSVGQGLVKHALRMKEIHGRYRHFFEYGDAEGYRAHVEEIRRHFQDIEKADSEESEGHDPDKS